MRGVCEDVAGVDGDATVTKEVLNDAAGAAAVHGNVTGASGAGEVPDETA